jgi:hypothetical protein
MGRLYSILFVQSYFKNKEGARQKKVIKKTPHGKTINKQFNTTLYE